MTKLTVTVKEAAELTGLSKDTIYNMCNAGTFPHRRVGEGRGKIIISIKKLEKWLEGENENDNC